MDLKLALIPAKFLLGPLYLSRPIVDVSWTLIATPNSVFMVVFPPVTHLAYPTPHPPPANPFPIAMLACITLVHM